MTIANTKVLAKVVAAFAVAALALSAFALSASAQTTTTTTTTTTASACASFNRDLTVGSTGPDVTALQQWLISKGFTIAAGATGYFGGQTQAAVARYQASVGISPAAGYFGPITRAQVNSVACAGGNTGGNDDDDDDDDDSNDDDDDGDLEGGEADLSDFELNDEESEGAEGEEMVDIATLEFDVEDGDVLVERIEFVASSTNDDLEEQPWDFFDTLYILDADGDEVAEIDASDRDEWDEEDENGDEGDEYRIVFTDIDTIVREDDRAQFTLSADIASNIDTADQAQEFDFLVPEDGVRAVDSEDIQHYIPSSDSEEVSFGFGEEEAGDLNINSSSDDPDSMTLISDEDDEADVDDAVFVFELENDDDVDVLVTDITIDVATSSNDSIDSLLDSATLVVDGEEYDGDINDDGTIDFEDVDFVVGGDDEVTVELFVTLAEDADGTVDFSVDDDNITAESDETGEDSDVSGSASSETHTIGETGISVDGTSTDADQNDAGTIGTFEITFEVTAEGDEDVYIFDRADDNDADDSSATSTREGVLYNIYQGSSQASATTTDSSILQSSADTVTVTGGRYYIVESGESETFTLTVSLDPAAGTTAQYYIELDEITFDDNEDDVTDDTDYEVPDESEFQTSPETLAA